MFVYIDKENAILLDVDTHREGVFANEKWLEMLDTHFPAILAPYHDESISDIYPHVSPSERQTLWDKGYSMGMTKVNGKIFHSPGVGRTTSGHSILVTKTVNELLRWISTTTKHFSTYRDEICEEFKLDSKKTVFKVQMGNTTFEIIDQSTGTAILTFPKIFDVRPDES